MNKKANLKSYSQLVSKLEVPKSYHFIVIKLPDGSKSICRSTQGQQWEENVLDVDFKTHPAWQEKLVQVSTSNNIKGFASKYEGLNLDI